MTGDHFEFILRRDCGRNNRRSEPSIEWIAVCEKKWHQGEMNKQNRRIIIMYYMSDYEADWSSLNERHAQMNSRKIKYFCNIFSINGCIQQSETMRIIYGCKNIRKYYYIRNDSIIEITISQLLKCRPVSFYLFLLIKSDAMPWEPSFWMVHLFILHK